MCIGNIDARSCQPYNKTCHIEYDCVHSYRSIRYTKAIVQITIQWQILSSWIQLFFGPNPTEFSISDFLKEFQCLIVSLSQMGPATLEHVRWFYLCWLLYKTAQLSAFQSHVSIFSYVSDVGNGIDAETAEWDRPTSRCSHNTHLSGGINGNKVWCVNLYSCYFPWTSSTVSSPLGNTFENSTRSHQTLRCWNQI